MILTCPACATRFNAKDEAFQPAGRKVRCAKCGETWFQPPPDGAAPPVVLEGREAESGTPPPIETPPVPEPSRDALPEPEPELDPVRMARAPDGPVSIIPETDMTAASPPPRTGWAVYAGWGLLIAAVALIAWSAAAYRDSIAEAWPRSASVYAALGMPVRASGIAFADVHYARQAENGHNVLAVTGTLVNVTRSSINVPALRVVLSDADGRVLTRWAFRPQTQRLGPKQRAVFATQLKSPPDAARHLTLELDHGD